MQPHLAQLLGLEKMDRKVIRVPMGDYNNTITLFHDDRGQITYVELVSEPKIDPLKEKEKTIRTSLQAALGADDFVTAQKLMNELATIHKRIAGETGLKTEEYGAAYEKFNLKGFKGEK